jgi:hypothetical protein
MEVQPEFRVVHNVLSHCQHYHCRVSGGRQTIPRDHDTV